MWILERGSTANGGIGGVGKPGTGGALSGGTGGRGAGGAATEGNRTGGATTGGYGTGGIGTGGVGTGGASTGGATTGGHGTGGIGTGGVGTGGASTGGANTGGTGTGGAAARCGDGRLDPGEECDQGSANLTTPYGRGLCTVDCNTAPFCGDGTRSSGEICDSGGSGATDLGACNPECSGYYEKKTIKPTVGQLYSTNLGGPAGADAICRTEFGPGWKALLVGGSRRATRTPFKGDDPQDWVISKYTYYYNASGQLLWRTDEIPLIGVHDGKRMDIYADVFPSGNYPWTGWAADWTTLPDDESAAEGTCQGWTNGSGYASFALPNLMPSQSEICGGLSFILCAQQ